MTAGTAGNVVFLGDEITQGWETTGSAALAQYFTGTKTMFNLGFKGDCTEHVLWRIQNGELASAPKAIFLMVGGNNTALYTETEEPTGQTSVGVRDIIDNLVSTRGSTTKIIVQAILPRGTDESDPYRYRNDAYARGNYTVNRRRHGMG